jgi:Phasin protein
MTPKDSQSRTSSPSDDWVAQAERLSRFQVELFEKVQEVNRRWLERVQSETTLAAEFATKMTSARSFPEAAAIYHEWASRQLKFAGEDARYAISTGQALTDMGWRLLQGDDKGKG